MTAILELSAVSKPYGDGAARTDVLAGINLSVAEGEFVAILGFSGTGKTTLISLMAGLIEPDSRRGHVPRQARSTGPARSAASCSSPIR